MWKGLTCMMKNYDESVGCYEHAIDVDPNYDASYYRLANLYAMSTDPVWAVMYAQNYQLHASKYERLMEMGKLIYNLYRENVTRKDGKWEVTFTKKVNLSAYASLDCDLPYNGFFYYTHKVVLDEGGFAGDTLTLADVARLHRKYVEIADTTAHDYYNVPVLDMERAALHEGHLEGYIMWMLRGADVGFGNKYFGTEQCDSVVNAFVEWYNNDYNKRGYSIAAQVKIAIFHANVVATIGVVFNREWRGEALAEHIQFRGDNFNVASRHLGILA